MLELDLKAVPMHQTGTATLFTAPVQIATSGDESVFAVGRFEVNGRKTLLVTKYVTALIKVVTLDQLLKFASGDAYQLDMDAINRLLQAEAEL